MAKSNSKMAGEVTRRVDFNLKKEDLMLLILEGRKEVMEDEIGKLATVSSKLRLALEDEQNKFSKEVKKKLLKTLNADAKKFAQAFGAKAEGDEEVDLAKVFRIDMSSSHDNIPFTKYSSSPIGDGKGGTYIKTQSQQSVTIVNYCKMNISIEVSLHGKVFASKSPFFAKKEYVSPCAEYSKDFVLIETALDTEEFRKMPEYIKMKEAAEALAANETLYSEIISEYDLFNRNQPRAKAKMIKEVLGRDESGQALLENIMTAASGHRLLAIEASKE